VKNDAEGVPMARAQAANTMAKINACGPASAFRRAVIDREGHRVALSQWNNFSARQSPWVLLDQ
jgi:hypothetical protein